MGVCTFRGSRTSWLAYNGGKVVAGKHKGVGSLGCLRSGPMEDAAQLSDFELSVFKEMPSCRSTKSGVRVVV